MVGIGPRAKNSQEVLKRAGRRAALTDATNELEIFFNLCVGRVYFRKSTRTLYFVDSALISVSEIIESVFRGLKQQANIQQLYMDVHKLFNASYCISLTDEQSKVVLVALRLRNIHIDT